MKRALLLCALVGVIVCTNRVLFAADSEAPPTAPLPPGMKMLFDGKTLDGWVQIPQYATNISGGDITDLPSLVKKLSDKSDPVSAYVSEQLDDAAKTALAANSDSNDNSKELKSALSKSLNKLIVGASIYDEVRFKNVTLRAETSELLKKNPQGEELMRLNRMLLEDAYAKEIWQSPSGAWVVKNGALASTGAGRGVLATRQSFGRYRIIFDMRHVSGSPDHQACVLVFCTAPTEGEKPLDALGGIQFQVPDGGSWDYRKGHNNGGKGEFNRLIKPTFNNHEWSRVEILVDPPTGTGRMAVAQPVGSKAVEVLDFKDESAGQRGPFALQMHNRGLFDEYTNIAIEADPKTDDLITTKD